MKPAPFEYKRPASLDEAVEILRQDDSATIIAGGQSLLPMLNLRIATAETLIDISRLKELTVIEDRDDRLRIGALVTHAAFEDGIVPDPFDGLLSRIASKIAYRAVRNLGTIGGSLALADPAADWPACMLALDASVIAASASGERCIAVADFLVDAYLTDLQEGEILVGIELPKGRKGVWGVGKVARKSGAFADSLAVAVMGTGEQSSRIALAGTSSCARLLNRTAVLLDGRPDADEAELREAIMADIDENHEDASPYQRRCHCHTVMTAISEARL